MIRRLARVAPPHPAAWMLFLSLCAGPSPTGVLQAQEEPLAFTGARILTVEGAVHDGGVLVIEGGRITAVGPASTPIPAGAAVRDAAGRWIMPGLVDTHSHIGLLGVNDRSAPVQPDLRTLDGLDARNPCVAKARAGGITTVNVMPGSGLLVGGQTLYLKLRRGTTVEDLLIRNTDGSIAGGLKMANGTNPQREPPFPGTRAKAAALVRERFVAAREYGEKLARAGADPEKQPDRDLGLEILLEALNGRRIVHHHTHRSDDILTVLRLKKEFGFRVVLHHVTEGGVVAAEIAEAGIPCSAIVVDSPGGKLEARELAWDTGARLQAAGVLTALHTDDPITDSRLFLRSAAFAVRAGMPPEEALRALTINGARMLDLEDRVGSLAPGKDADFIVLSGDPLSVYTRVLETWAGGDRVFDRSDPADHVFAVGGEGAGLPARATLCCFEEGEQ